ncbi:MAG: hypothetical protein HQM10_17315 [Candidatus Riflebacteria bacterium]|nr:hypothetical protein [Candidatus Riflebacteria bacterium]
MENNIKFPSRSGVAIVMVLLLNIVLVVFASALIWNFESQKIRHVINYDRMRAVYAAKSAIQLAIYKIRVLPTEFYNIAHSKAAFGEPVSETFNETWLSDFDSENPSATCPANIAMTTFSNTDNATYSCGITSIKLVSKTERGYVQDYIRVSAWGKCGKAKENVEELIEIGIAK